MKLMSAVRSLPLLALAALLSLASASPAQAQIDPYKVYVFASPEGLGAGQAARLSVYFHDGITADGRPSELPPGPCRGILRFVDAFGTTLVEHDISFTPDRGVFLDVQPALRAGQRAQVRAEVVAFADDRGILPKLIPSVEVFDVASGRTSIGDPGSIRGFNPQPEPPGDKGLFGLAGDQSAFVNASYIGLPTDSGLPPGPCNVLITLYNGAGAVMASQRATLRPGQTATLEFQAGAMPAGIRRRMFAVVTSDAADRSFVLSSIEVADTRSGQSSVFYPDAMVAR